MKRCPQCNRLEPDDTLGYCRADVTALLNDSGPVSAETGMVKFASGYGYVAKDEFSEVKEVR